MTKENMEKQLLAKRTGKQLLAKYNVIETMEQFVPTANAEGYAFTQEALIAVLYE